MMSPVPMVIDDAPPKCIINEEISFLHVGPVKSVRDAVENRVTLVRKKNSLFCYLPFSHSFIVPHK